MADIAMYKTYLDYPNQTGINQIAYPLRDSITIINPFFVILFGVMSVLTVGSYFAFVKFSGKTRFFNSILAASFSTTIISFFFALSGWVTPIHVLTFIGITTIAYIATIFYR